MEITVLQRVNYVIDNFGKTKNYFANEIGMSSTTVWRQLKGEQALSSKLIEGVLTAYSVWKAKYEELEKRYDQLLSIVGGRIKKASVG